MDRPRSLSHSSFHTVTARLGLLAALSAVLMTCFGASASARDARPAPVRTDAHRAPAVKSSSAPLRGIPGRWHWIFDSDFQGHAYNSTVWQPSWFEYGQQFSGPISPVESACYDSQYVTTASNGLKLALTNLPSNCSGATQGWTGSVLTTNPDDGRPAGGGFQFTYGIIQFKMYLPGLANGQIADWPVAMLLAQPGPNYGEDDVMEGLSGQVCSHLHTDYYANGSPLGACDPKLKPGWHIFSAYWEPGNVTWYYDSKRIGTYHVGISNQPMYIVLANTTPSTAPNVDRPDVARVAYVRVWQPVGGAPITTQLTRQGRSVHAG